MINQSVKYITRGRNQRRDWADLQEGFCIEPPNPCGKAKQWSASYARSFHAMLQRAKESGYAVIHLPGPKGSLITGHYHLLGADNICGQCKEIMPKYVLSKIMDNE